MPPVRLRTELSHRYLTAIRCVIVTRARLPLSSTRNPLETVVESVAACGPPVDLIAAVVAHDPDQEGGDSVVVAVDVDVVDNALAVVTVLVLVSSRAVGRPALLLQASQPPPRLAPQPSSWKMYLARGMSKRWVLLNERAIIRRYQPLNCYTPR